jgi:hypothetical protein
MGITILLFLIPLVAWILVAKVLFKHEFSIQEMGAQAVITGLALALLSFLSFNSLTGDTMMVNGTVTKLDPRKENCNMYWSDWPDGFCTNQYTRRVRSGETCTTINNKRSCTPTYKTQYRSVYPWERRYFVATTITSYEINREDNQGVKTPARFAEIKLGDPVTSLVSYTNYIKGASNSLFDQKLEDVPYIPYPEVFDYYHINRVFYTDLPEPIFLEEWNRDLEKLNADLVKFGANVIINITSKDETWAETLAQAWDAHNINDVVVTIGVKDEKISWVNVRSWSSDKMFDIVTRDVLLLLPRIDKDMINDIIRINVAKLYKQQKMEDFEYLLDDIETPTWLYVIAAIILLIVTPLTSLFLSDDNLMKRNNLMKRFTRRNTF